MITRSIFIFFMIAFIAIGFFIAMVLGGLFGSKNENINDNQNINDMISTLKNNNSNTNVIIIYNNISK